MNLKSNFKKSFLYTWYLYLLAIVVPSVAFPLAYSFMHRTQEFQKLSLFISNNISDNSLSNEIENKFKDKGVKNVDIISSDEQSNEYAYLQKLNVVGLNKCDILIIPETMLHAISPKTSMVELNNDIKNRCGAINETFYSVENIDYGIKLTEATPLINYNCLKRSLTYYAFFGGKSWNIGDYSNKNPNSTNAFDLMEFIIGK